MGLSRRTLLKAVPVAALPALAACDADRPGAAPDRGPAPSPTGAPTRPLGLRFPERFGWGAATSAYQVEGAAKEDGRGQSIWDTFSREPGRVRGGDTGDVAADHYHRYRQDLDLMKSLGLTSYRFSISWPRIQPDGRGTPNVRGLDFYKRLVDGLHERGIAPMATLFHWDLPQALQDRGGWEQRDSAGWFADYAEIVFRALGDRVPVWLTLNEPKTVVNVGYRYGVHAPGKRDFSAAMVAAHHLLLAHGRAVQAYRASGAKQRIGPALNLAPVYPADDTAGRDAPGVRTADGFENRLYLDPVLKGTYPADLEIDPLREVVRDGDLKVISSPIDLLAVQYYNPVFVGPGGESVTKLPTSIAEWQQIYPEGLYDVLTRVRRDYGDLPITITENGMPSEDELAGDRVADPGRITFLRDHLRQAHRAIADGVRLESYHVWSLLDNFEWAEGYSQRWGIVYVDYETQRRVPKDSAKWYADVIKANAV
ncbi:MAG TPA: GH1 family beta-glucosidase [Micromonosporaceae bacterium]|nr:GH1 family beta-glucosidase [Micromonosporaceae bacterium]